MTPQILDAPTVTQTLPPYGFGVDNSRTLKETFASSSGSFAGHSAVSSYLNCPERSRLQGLGVKPKWDAPSNMLTDLNALDFGTLNHALRAERFVRGSAALYSLLDRWAPELTSDDYIKTKLIWRLYDQDFPLGSDGWEYLAVEAEVRTALPLYSGAMAIRSVRYDTVIRMGGAVYSFECKTSARSGRSVIEGYKSQAMTQQALWNANESLVAQYGRMDGVIFDMLIKTQTPSVDRSPPECFSRHQEGLARQWLRSTDETVKFFRDPVTGRYPQMLQSCLGKYSACPMMALCHEEAYGAYAYPDGRAYDGA